MADDQDQLPATPPPSTEYLGSENPDRLPASVQIGVAVGRRQTAQESLVEKLTRAQIDKILDQELIETKLKHERQLLVTKNLTWMAAASLVTIVILCFLFLHYEKIEILRDVFVFLIGSLVGGVGGSSFEKSRRQKPTN